MTQSQDFRPESAPENQKNSVPLILLIIGGVGCGCFGLIILLGIISAIALPNFLNQANKARETEAKVVISSILAAQQAYHLETDQLTNSIGELGVTMPGDSPNYDYAIAVQPDDQSVIVTAQAKEETISSYTGAVFIISQDGEASITVKGLCQSDEATTISPPIPTLNEEGMVECAPGSTLK